jgi:hypothetical protein
MLAHNLKQILQIVPEAKELIKKADIEQDYPLDNKDSCIASYLRYVYLTKVAHKPVEIETVQMIEKAAELYGVKSIVGPLQMKLEKYAQEKFKMSLHDAQQLTVKQAEVVFEGSLTGFADIEKAAQEAIRLDQTYGKDITSEEVNRYVGRAFFDKRAAVDALQARGMATGKEVFNKFAEIIDRSMEGDEAPEVLRDICEKVAALDKKAGLHLKGFNPYKEFLITKEARIRTILMVKVAGQQVPYEKLMKLGSHRIGQYLGKEVQASMTGNPLNDKAVIESLPLDSQRVLQSLLKNV